MNAEVVAGLGVDCVQVLWGEPAVVENQISLAVGVEVGRIGVAVAVGVEVGRIGVAVGVAGMAVSVGVDGTGEGVGAARISICPSWSVTGVIAMPPTSAKTIIRTSSALESPGCPIAWKVMSARWMLPVSPSVEASVNLAESGGVPSLSNSALHRPESKPPPVVQPVASSTAGSKSTSIVAAPSNSGETKASTGTEMI